MKKKKKKRTTATRGLYQKKGNFTHATGKAFSPLKEKEADGQRGKK